MPSKLSIRVVILIGILSIIGIGGYAWWSDALSASNPQDSSSKIFVIEPGENVRSVATRLKDEHLIKDSIGFFLKIKIFGYDDRIQAGAFRLSSSMDVNTIIEELTHGTLDVWVTTLEGWRVEEIALKLTKELMIPEQEFLRTAQEGYMFPDTYLFPKEASGSAVTQILKANFDKRVTPEIRNAIVAKGLTFEEGIVLASIVEREGRSETDRPMIAGILLKRLQNDWLIQADATLQYALGYQSDQKSWWKKSLFDEDKKIDSPYNTYKHLGLPPGPICNPGLEAITAVAEAEESDFWFYLHDTKGIVHYARTLEEHEANIAKYLLTSP